MPELKRVPQDGKMNTDFHERILPPGSYREALNINIGRSETSEVGTVENLIGNTNISKQGLASGYKTIGSFRDNENERIYYFVTNNNSTNGSNTGTHYIYEYSQISNITRTLVSTSELNFHQGSTITGINLVDGLLFWTDDRNPPRKINVQRAIDEPTYYNTGFDDLASVARQAPWEAPQILSVSNEDEDGTVIVSNFLEDKLPRFSYRWQFADGEYSVYAPFSPIVFSRLGNAEEDTLTNLAIRGEVPSFVNAVKSARMRVPTPRGFGITKVELLYKETNSSTVYIVLEEPVIENSFVEFFYASQDPFRALPSNQLTRVSDNVPRVAKSQELAGARLIYGNYLQNYDLPEIGFRVTTTTESDARHSVLGDFSVKSRRTYQVGIVLVDRYGRQSPVILSSTGGDTIFVNPIAGADGFQALEVLFDGNTVFPDWAHSYRIVVKQREQEYYNWISISPGFGLVNRTGDSINKIPRDTTAQDPGNASISPTAASVYPKLVGGVNDTRSGLIKVQEIQNPGGVAVVPRAPGRNGLVVYETEPVTSNLDIFYETSTGGLVTSSLPGSSVFVSFYNCYILTVGGAHVEVNRLRLGFNEPFFDIGVRAHIVVEDFAGEERRFNTLIHSSGLFNSRTGLNQLNQFNESEGGLAIRLDPADGSIQKLYAEDTQLIIWQEDKVSRSPIDKDFIFSAEGGAVPVTSNTAFLGTIAPYVGEYGISRNPESFAIYGTRKYFTDRNRGVVLRLSNDGLSEISQLGMSDFFRDALRTSTEVIGSFDEYHNTYHLTIIGEGYTGSKDTNRATASDGYFTLAYEEDTKGWPTFKSFKKESGLTLNNTYYTFSGGELYQHNLGLRNTFYEDTKPSYIDFIFNDAPSSVKQFMTLGYEGDAGWECRYVETDIETLGTNPNTNTDTLRSVSLNILGAADNTSISGRRRIMIAEGNTARWTLAISPIDPTYHFNVEGATTIADLLTLTGTDATITGPTLEGGVAYFDVEYTVTDANTQNVDVTLGGDGASLIFNISLLQVSIDEDISGLQGPATISFDTAGSANLSGTLIPSGANFYVEKEDLTFDLTGIDSYIAVGTTETTTQDGNNVDYTIPVTVPGTAGNTGTMVITAPNNSARQKGTVVWEVPSEGSFNRSGDDLEVRVSPYDSLLDRSALLTIQASATQIVNPSLTLSATNATPTITTDDRITTGRVVFDILSNIVTGVTTGTPPSITVTSTLHGDVYLDASLGTYTDPAPFASTGNGNIMFIGTNNIPMTITASDDWINLLDADGTDATSPFNIDAATNFQINVDDYTMPDISIAFASTSIEVNGEVVSDLDGENWTPLTGDDRTGFSPSGYTVLDTLAPDGSTVYRLTYNEKDFYLFRAQSGVDSVWVIGPETRGSSLYITRPVTGSADNNEYELSTTNRTWTDSATLPTLPSTVTSTSRAASREGTITLSKNVDRITLSDITITITQNG